MKGELNLGKPLRLSVPSKNGEVLSVDIYGKIFYDYADSGADDSWIITKPNITYSKDDGFHLVSSQFRMVIDYKPEYGECLTASRYNRNGYHTVWYLTPDSEIYTIDQTGEKRYLWSILDGIYVTPDEHLAEKWTAVSMEGYDIGSPKPEPPPNDYTSLILIIILLFGIFFFIFRRKK